MFKWYIDRWKEREKPEERHIDYWFASDAKKAACWETKEEAENNCVIFNHHHIVIRSSQGGTHVCGDFKIEERAPREFVVFCLAPFILTETTSGESSNRE